MPVNILAPRVSHTAYFFSTASAVLISMNYIFLCHYPDKKRLRYAFLAASGPVALLLVPLGVNSFPKALSVQVASVFAIACLRAIEYCVLDDPRPSPRSNWQYFLVALRDMYLPFENGASVGRGHASPPPHTQHQPRPGGPKHSPFERQPLVAPGDSYAAGVARLLLELALQYVIYDCLLTLCVKPRFESAAASSGGGGRMPPPLLSAASVQVSVAFTVCLYLHFAMPYKSTVLALSLARPDLLYHCQHLYCEPWRGLMSVSEFWQRWHQLLRMTFLRLAYRPARAGVRRLLGGGGSPAAATAGKDADGKPAGRRGGAAVEEAVALLAVFCLSGVIHEFICWAAFGAARGWQLAFFLLHGVAVLLEQVAAAAIARSAPPCGGALMAPVLPGLLRGALRLASLGFNLLSSVWFTWPMLEAGYHWDIWHPVSPVEWVVRGLSGDVVR